MTRIPFRFCQTYSLRLALYAVLVLLGFKVAFELPNQSSDFFLHGRVLEAMENGPVVVEGTRLYEGKGPLAVHRFGSGDCFGVDWQPLWRGELFVRLTSGGNPYGQETLAAGENRTAVRFVHQDYAIIPPGRVRLRLHWPVYEPGGFGKQVSPFDQFLEDPKAVLREGFRKTGPTDFGIGKLIAEPGTTILVDVAPATPENLLALRNRFEKELERPDITPEKAGYIGECIIRTRHKELSQVVLKLFDYPAPRVDYLLLEQVYDSHPDPGEANDFLLRYVTRNNALRPAIPFTDTRWNEHTFQDEQIQTLRDAKNPWVRMLTCVTFPKQCPEKWQADLLAEMSKLAELRAVVEQLRLLDDPKFAVREKATARLAALEDLAEPAIRAHLKGPVSPEARRRCKQILADLQANKHDFNASSAMSILENASGPEGKAMLEAFAKAPPDCRVAKRAKEALERRRQGAKPSAP